MKTAKNENSFGRENVGGPISFKMAKQVWSDKIHFLPKLIYMIKSTELCKCGVSMPLSYFIKMYNVIK